MGIYAKNIRGSKYESNISLNANDNISVSATGKFYAYAIRASQDLANISLESKNICLNTSSEGLQKTSESVKSAGIYADRAAAVNLSADNVAILAQNSGLGSTAAVYAESDSDNRDRDTSIVTNAKNIELTAASNNSNLATAVIASWEKNKACVTLGDENTESLILNAVNSTGYAIGVYSFVSDSDKENSYGGDITLLGKNISISADGNIARGIQTSDGSKASSVINLGSSDSVISVDATGTEEAIGIIAFEHGQTTVNGQSLTVTATSGKNYSVGIQAQNNGTEGTAATININTANTTVKVNDALVAFSGVSLNVESNLYTEADNAVVTRGNSSININTQGNDHIVQLNGDINFNVTNDGSSGLIADSSVNIKLTNNQSYLNGNIVKTNS